jgi:hypothetical protein
VAPKAKSSESYGSVAFVSLLFPQCQQASGIQGVS